MSEEVLWPPTSPKAALLSSPSGRKRYSEAMHRSPIKRSRTTPNLLSRLQDARNDTHNEEQHSETDDEDEETLKLQLAAIEAKLKLKKLQQSKTRPDSSQRTGSTVAGGHRSETVQVNLSPVRRSRPPVEPRSPSRVLLGIDKGKTGADVSLKRAKSVSDRPSTRTLMRTERSLSRVSQLSSRLQNASSTPNSFSERMAEVRDKDKGREDRRIAAQGARTSSFDIDKAEIEGYRALAEDARKKMPAPAARTAMSQSFTRDEVLQVTAAEGSGAKMARSKSNPNLTAASRSSRHRSPSEPDSSLFEGFSGINLSTRILPHSFLKRTLPEDRFSVYTVPDLLKVVKSPEYEMPDDVGDYVVFAIIASKSSPLDQKVKADGQSVGTNDWERKWDDGSQNQRKFIAMTLTDLEWTVDLYLFGTAVSRYHRLSPGTVIAILNPNIMPPKRGKEDTGAFSLTLNGGDDTVLEIGTASELGYCNAKKRDGGECGQWVNIAKTEICEWHLNMQLSKAEQGRMAINSGSNGFGRGHGHGRGGAGFGDQQFRRTESTFGGGPRGARAGEGKNGLLPRKEGQQFNSYTGESYYVAKSTAPPRSQSSSSSNPFSSNINTARTLDLDDPFVSEGQLARDRKQLLTKRKERQAQEMQIAKQLGKSHGSGAGAEYMRHRSGTATKKDAGKEFGSRATAEMIKGSIMRDPSSASSTTTPASTAQSAAGTTTTTTGAVSSGTAVGARSGLKRRSGHDVRLSPVKKTRFVTDKGIREAGRESLGVVTAVAGAGGDHDDDNNDHDDDDDDDLDIV